MSQMCPSSSHQLVAAAIAFRRARRKFPKNFGQILRSVNHDRNDNKIEPLSSMKPCKNCEQRFACQKEIRCVRSDDVWPRLTGSSIEHPRTTRSTRENNSLPDREKEDATTTTIMSRGGCACRRISKSARKNCSVSFRVDEKWNNRCSAGDVAAVPRFVETISCKCCKMREKPSDCRSTGKRDDFEDARRKKHDEKWKPAKHSSCLERYSMKNDNLDLLYDRSCIRPVHSVSFPPKENDGDSSLEDERGCLIFPGNVRDFENRTREDSIESATGPRGIIPSAESTGNCDCVINVGESRSQSLSSRRRQRCQYPHRILCEKESQKNVRYEDGTVNPEASRSSCFKQSNRLCKDCALGECTKSCSLVGSAHEDREPEEEEERGATANDTCAIKHKDSMALIVEKFNNRKTATISCDDEEIFKSDEDCSRRTSMNDKIKVNRTCDEQDHVDYEESQDEDITRRNVHRNAGLSGMCKFHSRTSSKNKKCRRIPHRCCCCSSETIL